MSGCENWRVYWIIACTSPTVMAPVEMRSPPTTAISTYWTLPMNIITGWIRLDTNCAPKLASWSASFSSPNRASTSR